MNAHTQSKLTITRLEAELRELRRKLEEANAKVSNISTTPGSAIE